jgi:hypothetical protein
VRVIVGDLGRAAGAADRVVKRLLRESLEHPTLGRSVFGRAGRGHKLHQPLGHLDPAWAMRLRPLTRKAETGAGHIDVPQVSPRTSCVRMAVCSITARRQRRSARDALEDGEEV